MRANQILVSRTTVANYMRELGIRCRIGRRFKSTTNSDNSFNTAPNLLNREFDVNGFIYLTTVIDLYDRKVVGWSISTTLKAEYTVVAALKMAVHNRTPKKGMIFHSDRGVQYASNEFVSLLGAMKIVQSISLKGNCWDNAMAESFFKSLKCELVYSNGTVLIKADYVENSVYLVRYYK